MSCKEMTKLRCRFFEFIQFNLFCGILRKPLKSVEVHTFSHSNSFRCLALSLYFTVLRMKTEGFLAANYNKKHKLCDSCHHASVCWEAWVETEQESLDMSGHVVWLHKAAPNLCWGRQTPRGSDCGSWYVSKTSSPPSHPFRLLLLCLPRSRCWSLSVFRRKQLLSQRDRRTSF